MLVVLAILAATASVFALNLRSTSGGADVAAVTRVVMAKLTEARSRAIGRAQAVHVDIDPGGRTIAASGDAKAMALPADILITATSARSQVSALGGARITFYSDGSSTGGVIAIQRGTRGSKLAVSWLTGRVTAGSGP